MRRLLPERPDRLGVLLTPGNGNREWWPSDTAWACDNDCFQGLNPPAYLRMLARVHGFTSRPAWVSCPDVVGDVEATERNYHRWSPMLRAIGMPVAWVMQDGFDRFKWNRIASNYLDLAAVFVGGSTRWKLSDGAARLTLEAHEAGLLCHWGRVNSWKRIAYLCRGMRDGRLWCDTIDGTGWVRFSDINIPKAIRFIDKGLKCQQGVMFGGIA